MGVPLNTKCLEKLFGNLKILEHQNQPFFNGLS